MIILEMIPRRFNPKGGIPVKKKFSLAVAAIMILGVLAAIPFLNNLSPVKKDCSILTPASEEAESDQTRFMTIYEPNIPLSDGPGSPTDASDTSQNIDPYLQKIIDLAVLCKRKVAVSGRSMVNAVALAQELGYKTVFWSLAYVDWYQDKQPTKEEAFSKLLPRIHPGAIVLLHSTSKTNSDILDELLTKWEEMGYTFKSLEEI